MAAIAEDFIDRTRVSNRREAGTVGLTGKEIECLRWCKEGKTNWEIGEILGIAERTVNEHAQTAFRKLGAANRAQAIAIAVRERLINI